jgi:protein tyrosine phosphatase
MIWQERVPAIVMITNLVEGKKAKCDQYWPLSGSLGFGPFQVSITNQLILADYTINTLSVELSGEVESVVHFHYTAWPDHGVPDYATSILSFHKRVMKDLRKMKGPLLVHCSAGVDRTGTFITIDHVLEQIEKKGFVDIPAVIQNLRQQRTTIVQTPDQYVFIHDAILESMTCGDTQIEAGNLRRKLRKLQTRDESGRTELDLQFAILDQVSTNAADAKVFAARNNISKNRSTEFLPVDKWRVVLKGENPDYINATNVNGYKQHRAFIITQGPMQSTSRDFWKMVCSRKCSVIVMLSDLVEQGEEVCYQYWPGQTSQSYGEFRVELMSEEINDGYVMRTFCIQQSKLGKAHQVMQFQISNWTADGLSSHINTVISMIEQIAKLQRKTGNNVITIHGIDTVSRSAVFCAIITTIERCKTEGVVDVFQVVKAMRNQKPGAVRTVEQYLSIYKALLVFLDSFETYANFVQ